MEERCCPLRENLSFDNGAAQVKKGGRHCVGLVHSVSVDDIELEECVAIGVWLEPTHRTMNNRISNEG